MAKSSQQRDLSPGALEKMILQSLRYLPMQGYALVQHIKERSNELLQVEEGSPHQSESPTLQNHANRG